MMRRVFLHFRERSTEGDSDKDENQDEELPDDSDQNDREEEISEDERKEYSMSPEYPAGLRVLESEDESTKSVNFGTQCQLNKIAFALKRNYMKSVTLGKPDPTTGGYIETENSCARAKSWWGKKEPDDFYKKD